MDQDRFKIASWTRYERQLRALGIVQVFRGTSGVSFKVDDGSLWNGDSYKGYEYDIVPPDHAKTSLDGYRISPKDKDQFGNDTVYKPIKGHWYLYLFINGR